MLPNNDLTTYFLETLLSVTNTAVSYHVLPRLQYCDLHTDMQGLCFHQHISKNEGSKSWKLAFVIIWNIILSMYIIHSHSPPYMLKHTWHHTHVHACKDSSACFHYCSVWILPEHLTCFLQETEKAWRVVGRAWTEPRGAPFSIKTKQQKRTAPIPRKPSHRKELNGKLQRVQLLT